MNPSFWTTSWATSNRNRGAVLLTLLLFSLLSVGCLPRQAKSPPVIFISGNKAQEVQQDFANDRVIFRPLPFAAPNPAIPVYVRGPNNNDGAMLIRLKHYFGGQLAVYDGTFRNHRYIEHSALYLPGMPEKAQTVFAGTCGEDYALEIEQVGDQQTVTLDRWQDDPPAYQRLYTAKGPVVWQQGVAQFVADEITPAAMADASSLPVLERLRFGMNITAGGAASYQRLHLVDPSDLRLIDCQLSTSIPRKAPDNARPLR